jgi:5'-nucleotidase
MSMSVTGYIGTVAAFCTTVAFVPQIVKLRKQGGKDLSYSMLFLYLTGVLLWLVYGVRAHAEAVAWANAMAAVLVLVSIVLKANPPAKKLAAGARRLRIAIDMDEVIADAFGKHLDQYNERAGANLTPELISKKGLNALIPVEQREVFHAIPHTDGFFADMELVAGSREALLELSRNHDIFITSAAMEVPGSFADKFQWMETHFPFIPPSRIVFCGDKNIINADVLIDDRSRHFKGFRGTGILFTAPHNATEAAELRANNWNDVLKILEGVQPGKAGAEAFSRNTRKLSMNPAG